MTRSERVTRGLNAFLSARNFWARCKKVFRRPTCVPLRTPSKPAPEMLKGVLGPGPLVGKCGKCHDGIMTHHGNHSASEPAEELGAEDAQQHWEERYTAADRVWSGRVNATTAAVVTGLGVTPGAAADLGSGEGGDALWLATQGWDVLGIDISPTAVARASAEAERLGVSARFEAHDLEAWTPDRTFDLITASFLHSTIALSRQNIFRTAAGAIAHGGHLVVVSHMAVPSWAGAQDHAGHNVFLEPGDEWESLKLPAHDWTVVVSEVWQRETTAPDGTPAVLEDAVLVVRRN